jgi:molybdenum cofactor guanylyltransferase
MIPAVILAGGAGRRIGGDKALQPLGRGTLLSAVQGRLTGQVGLLALNARGDPARFAGYGLPVLPDPVAGQPGPLAGVLAALDWAEGQGADRVLVVPCDTPFLPGDLVTRMAAQPGLVVARDDQGGLHPTVALWPVAMAGAVRAALSAGERRLRR